MSETPAESTASQTPAWIPRALWGCWERYGWRWLSVVQVTACKRQESEDKGSSSPGSCGGGKRGGSRCSGPETMDPLGTQTEHVVRTWFTPTSFCVSFQIATLPSSSTTTYLCMRKALLVLL